jgi:hypothetical protein
MASAQQRSVNEDNVRSGEHCEGTELGSSWVFERYHILVGKRWQEAHPCPIAAGGNIIQCLASTNSLNVGGGLSSVGEDGSVSWTEMANSRSFDIVRKALRVPESTDE